MACGSIECQFDEVVDNQATNQARRAFLGVEAIKNNPDGVEELTASAWSSFWNSCVRWFINDQDTSSYEATPVETSDGKWGIRTGPDMNKIRRRKK